MDLPDESLCFSHAVVAFSFPLQMLHLQEIQLGSKEGTETPQKHRENEKQRRGETTGRETSKKAKGEVGIER